MLHIALRQNDLGIAGCEISLRNFICQLPCTESPTRNPTIMPTTSPTNLPTSDVVEVEEDEFNLEEVLLGVAVGV